MSEPQRIENEPVVEVVNPAARSAVVLVCEHASNVVPAELGGLGLDAATLESHIAWDPGAMAVARGLAEKLDAVLVAGRVSRLVYDCNRPPGAPGAIVERSEDIAVPGNHDLDPDTRAARVAGYYEPFRERLARVIGGVGNPVVVTIHSFTPIFMGQPRAVEIGILHDVDTRLADAMLDVARAHTDLLVCRNAPYGPEDGVTHTLREHGIAHGHPNVMIEIRNDLIAGPEAQARMAGTLAAWIQQALRDMGRWGIRCTG
ncbi:N-formylglutamate amidohydrolase [Palleronia sp. LCG004]|uniref:N-formylglutamate amidohydrolase n=1 Tax=Palleronia sp. LCG004 TaxID=3079304 RepID=UPI002942081A|nr:N-formylglutamate amidohydrolase [Palleronia sp. LCG004]WOI56234.1 N-formylglutamate amidohydrolase [Palleronia sp. LCG004]